MSQKYLVHPHHWPHHHPHFIDIDQYEIKGAVWRGKNNVFSSNLPYEALILEFALSVLKIKKESEKGELDEEPFKEEKLTDKIKQEAAKSFIKSEEEGSYQLITKKESTEFRCDQCN